MKKIIIPEPIALENGQLITFIDFVVNNLLSDTKWGVSLTKLKLAAHIKNAIENISVSIELDHTHYSALMEVMEAPTNGYQPAIAIQLIPFFDAISGATDE